MKSSSIGLKVRFFKVKIATGLVCTSGSIWQTFDRRLLGIQNVEHTSGNYRQILSGHRQHVAQVIRHRGSARPRNSEPPITKGLIHKRAACLLRRVEDPFLV